MNLIKKIVVALIFFCGLSLLNSCSNLKLKTHAGVSIDWGTNGPTVRPHVDVDVYNGGRHH